MRVLRNAFIFVNLQEVRLLADGARPRVQSDAKDRPKARLVAAHARAWALRSYVRQNVVTCTYARQSVVTSTSSSVRMTLLVNLPSSPAHRRQILASLTIAYRLLLTAYRLLFTAYPPTQAHPPLERNLPHEQFRP